MTIVSLGLVAALGAGALSLDVAPACGVDALRLEALLALEGVEEGELTLACASGTGTATATLAQAGLRRVRRFSIEGRTEPELSRYVALVVGEAVAQALPEPPPPEPPPPPPPPPTVARPPPAPPATSPDADIEVSAGGRYLWVPGAGLPGAGLSAAWTHGAFGLALETAWGRGGARSALGAVDVDVLVAVVGPYGQARVGPARLRVGAGVEVGGVWGRGVASDRAEARAVSGPVFGPAGWLDVDVGLVGPLHLGVRGVLAYATAAVALTSEEEVVVAVDGLHGWLGLSLGWSWPL